MNAVANTHFLKFNRWMHANYEYIGSEWAECQIDRPDGEGLDEFVARCYPDVFEEWKVFELEGRQVLDYLGYNAEAWTRDFTYPIIVNGDSSWGDYSVEARVTPLSRADVAMAITEATRSG